MSVSQPVSAAPAPPIAPSRGDSVGVSRGGWFTRITVTVVVILWLIPAVGVLITSFRP